VAFAELAYRIDLVDEHLAPWDRNWPMPHNVRPKPIVTGVTR